MAPNDLNDFNTGWNAAKHGQMGSPGESLQQQAGRDAYAADQSRRAAADAFDAAQQQPKTRYTQTQHAGAGRRKKGGIGTMIVLGLIAGVFWLFFVAIPSAFDWYIARLDDLMRLNASGAPALLSLFVPPLVGTVLWGPRWPLGAAFGGMVRRLVRTIIAVVACLAVVVAGISLAFALSHAVAAGHFDLADLKAQLWVGAAAGAAVLVWLASGIGLRAIFGYRRLALLGALAVTAGFVGLALFGNLGDTNREAAKIEEFVLGTAQTN